MSLRILGICGSIRKDSSSHVILEEAQKQLSELVDFKFFEGIAVIPAFDGREEDPEAVRDFKDELKTADGIIICTPEYAFGVPGALKNALDWTVGTSEFVGKPVALITASSQGEKGHESLQHTLHAISAELDQSTTLLISFIRAKVKEGRISDPETKNLLTNLINRFVERIEAKKLNLN